MSAPLYGCIEAGGTKFVLGIVGEDRTILREARIATAAPDDTLAQAVAFFAQGAVDAGETGAGEYAAFGIGSFGPVELDRRSPDWGRLLDTPKPGWSGADIAGAFGRAFDRPVGLDTDVNAAALAESLWGAAKGVDVAVYVTVGTGIGGGAVVGGQTLHGARHPEMGHMLPRRHPEDRDFAGVCPFHGDCLEGLASGPAIIARWGRSLSDLPGDHVGHAIVAHYLAQLVIAQRALLSPGRIVLGGGVAQTRGLVARVAEEAARLAAGYFGQDDQPLLVPPGLGGRAGLLGAYALARAAR